jgi:CrcB protein
VLVVMIGERVRPTRYVRQFFGTGLLGAYTTYSTFAVETDLLLRHGRIGIAVAYVLATVVGGLLAAAAGAWLGGTLPLREPQT